jgi:hypothetical protein
MILRNTKNMKYRCLQLQAVLLPRALNLNRRKTVKNIAISLLNVTIVADDTDAAWLNARRLAVDADQHQCLTCLVVRLQSSSKMLHYKIQLLQCELPVLDAICCLR